MLIPLAWLIAYVPSFVPLFRIYNMNGLKCRTFQCSEIPLVSDEGVPQKNFFTIVSMLVLMFTFLPLVAINIATYLRLWKHTQRMLDEMRTMREEQKIRYVKKEKTMGQIMTIVTLVFFISYCPIIMLLAIHPNASTTHTWEAIFFALFVYSGQVINPLVYMKYHKKYRQEITSLFNRAKGSIRSSFPQSTITDRSTRNRQSIKQRDHYQCSPLTTT